MAIKKATYRDLRIWREAVDLSVDVYRCTAEFPRSELYGLTSQMRRAAVSIASNIAEGKGHLTNGDFRRFLLHARGSLLELQTQIVIAQGLGYFNAEEAAKLSTSTDELGRGLNRLIQVIHVA